MHPKLPFRLNIRKQSAMLVVAFVLFLMAMTRCNVGNQVGKDVSARINNPITDTLFITLPEGYDDETCTITIHDVRVNYSGRDIVQDNKIWFDVRHLPSGTYLVWIKVGDLYFSRRFVKEGPYLM